MAKFGLNYRLIIEDRTLDLNIRTLNDLQNSTINREIVIESPLTVEFDITKDISFDFGSGKLNQARISIRNLAETTRRRIEHDIFNIIDNKDPNFILQSAKKLTSLGSRYQSCTLQSGYGDNLSTIFTGNIIEGSSYKEKESPDIVTFLLVSDGDYAVSNSYSNFTTYANARAPEVIYSLVNDMKGTTIGTVGKFNNTFSNFPFNGNSYSLLNKHFRNKVFIDDERVNIINYNDVMEGDVSLLTSETGLLTTPAIKDRQIVIDIMFEPRIILGQFVQISSSFNPLFDGQYKVSGIRHRGVIGGFTTKCITTLILFLGYEKLGQLNKL